MFTVMPAKDLAITFLCLLMAVSCYSQDTFGHREQTILRDEQIVDISNKSFRQNDELLVAFKSMYHEFISKNSIDEEGQFVPGGSTPDNDATNSYFMEYVSKNRMLKVLTVARRCKGCLGNSKIWVETEPKKILSIKKVEIDCPKCPSDGRIPTEVTFTLICSSKSVPILPEKPRVVRQQLLVGKADAGDSFSQVDYAAQLEKGTKGVDQNISLSQKYFIKAAVQGSGYGLDGVLRTLEASSARVPRQVDFVFMLRLVQANLAKNLSGKASYYVNADELGVAVPEGMTYSEVKISEILARTFHSYFLSKDLEPSHFSPEGSLNLLRTMKKQIEKAPLVAARAKVEYVLISYALAGSVEGFGSERLSLVKEAAVSLDPVAFGILGDICATDANASKNYQAASIFFKISQSLRKDSLAESKLASLQLRYDKSVTSEMVEEFEKTKVAGRANINFIEAMMKINNQKNDNEK
jgi:hypothetical protein